LVRHRLYQPLICGTHMSESAAAQPPTPPPEELPPRPTRRRASAVEVGQPIIQLTEPGSAVTPSLADCAPYLRGGRVTGKDAFKHLAKLIQLRANTPYPESRAVDICVGKLLQNLAVHVMLWDPACVPTDAYSDNDDLVIYANCPDGPYVYLWKIWYAEVEVAQGSSAGYMAVSPRAVMPQPLYEWYLENLRGQLEETARGSYGAAGENS